jgi:hypothetical protein
MVAYKFYWHDDIKGYQFIETVTERRRNPERITPESIMNLGRTLFGRDADPKRIHYVRVDLVDVGLRLWDPVSDLDPDRRSSGGPEWKEISDFSEYETWEKGLKNRWGG